jgi:hypothetical protein
MMKSAAATAPKKGYGKSSGGWKNSSPPPAPIGSATVAPVTAAVRPNPMMKSAAATAPKKGYGKSSGGWKNSNPSNANTGAASDYFSTLPHKD